MNRAPAWQTEGISKAYEVRVRAACGGDFPDALQLQGRLDPARWLLEWSFARWVGSALGVDEQIWQRITLSNVLILTSVVWRDDLEDGELDVADRGWALGIGDALFAAAMEPYHALLPAGSRFWKAVEHWMSLWRAATIRAATAEPSALAIRGTPLKIPAHGLCLVAGRPDAFPALEASIEHTITGLVLYDHFVDWRKDLAGSRWNAFVECAMAASSKRRDVPTVSDVEAAMLTRPIVEDYFGMVRRELAAGEKSASEVGVHDLALHLRELARELRDEGQQIAARYTRLSQQATELMFGRQTVTA